MHGREGGAWGLYDMIPGEGEKGRGLWFCCMAFMIDESGEDTFCKYPLVTHVAFCDMVLRQII